MVYAFIAYIMFTQTTYATTLPVPLTYSYDMQYKNMSEVTQQPVGVSVIAFDRPHYLAQVIQSLEANPEADFMPFCFFLDGGPYAQQEENIAIINRSTLKNKVIICQSRNYGCTQNNIDAQRFMFDWCGFKTVINVEDDLVVSPTFIRFSLALHSWARTTFSNVGVTVSIPHCLLPYTTKTNVLNRVEINTTQWWIWWGACINKDVWDAIKPMLYTLEAFIESMPDNPKQKFYRSKPGKSSIGTELTTWLKERIANKTPEVSNPYVLQFPTTNINAHLTKNLSKKNRFEGSQDVMFSLALWCAGYCKIQTTVNRGLHIGQEGITFSQNSFEAAFGLMNLDDFTEHDKHITDFTWS